MTKILARRRCWGTCDLLLGIRVAHAAALGEMGLRSIPSEDGVVAAIKKDVHDAGAVLCAGQGHEQVTIARRDGSHIDKITKGPYGFMVVYPNGRDPSHGQAATDRARNERRCALLAAILVSLLRPSFVVRVASVTLVGILASIMTLVPYWNWYGFPTDFTLAQIAENTVGWFLAGLCSH